MSRMMVRDGQDAFRVVVRRRHKIVNPEYEQGNGERYYILTDEEYNTEYGPYPKVGTARGVQAHEAYKPAYVTESGEPRAELQWGVVDTWIEKAVEIKWEKVPE